MDDRDFMRFAIDQGAKSLSEGGVPVGASIAVDGALLAVGHNRRVQQGSVIRDRKSTRLNSSHT